MGETKKHNATKHKYNKHTTKNNYKKLQKLQTHQKHISERASKQATINYKQIQKQH